MLFDIDGKSEGNLKNRDLGTVVPWEITKTEKKRVLWN